jgi:hypothetical protein
LLRDLLLYWEVEFGCSFRQHATRLFFFLFIAPQAKRLKFSY